MHHLSAKIDYKMALTLNGDKVNLVPSKDYGLIDSVKNDDLSHDDMHTYLCAIMDEQGLVLHNIEGFNQFIEHGLSEILQHLFKIERLFPNQRKSEEDSKVKSIRLNIDFFDIYVGMPRHVEHSGDTVDLYPNKARLTGIPYSAPMYMNGTVTITAIMSDDTEESISANLKEFSPCNIPMMTGSSHCHTSGLTRRALKHLKEDPREAGGVFIFKKQEYIIDHSESSKYNEVGTHFIDKAELVRSDFISQPPNEMFGNSSQIKVSYMASGLITVEINSVKFSNAKIPFYLVYHLLGMTSGKDIVKTIIFDLDDNSIVNQRILQILDIAFEQTNEKFASLQYESDRESLIKGMGEKMVKYITSTNFKKDAETYVNQDLLQNMDNVFLPHMGKSEADRIRKLRFLGIIIRKTLLVHLRVMDPTDRDSYSNKRLHGPGICFPKLFKTLFNSMIILPAINLYRKEFKNTSWSQIKGNPARIREIFQTVLNTADLTRGLEQGITSNNKTIMNRKRALTNRVSSKILERKNDLNVKCSLRSISTHGISNASKQTERADKIRRVHPSQVGYTDPTHSADSGENVGLKRNMSPTATITSAGNSLNLKLKMLQDPEVILFDDVASEDIQRQRMSFVYVNGEIIGCCREPWKLVDKYRRLRREGKVVDRFTTISWDERINEVKFWLDAGRLTRPLLIVDHNLATYEKALHEGKEIPFVQNIRLTKDHVTKIKQGKLYFENLVEQGIVEYISPEECENCLIAPSLQVLREHKHDITTRYTHCDIEVAILGLASLVAPFANHTQPARITYETNQSRQTAGIYSLAYPFRADKNRALQHYNEMPLIKTLTNRFTTPNGSNVVVAYISNGSNQEDSSDFCQASADRGLYRVSYYKNESIELEQEEDFITPDPATTKNMKVNGNYKKLVDGVVPVGTKVVKGDILIGCVAKNNKQRGQQKANDPYEYVDRSLMYKSDEAAVVSMVVQDRNAAHEKFITVVLRYERPIMPGDKTCLTPDHEVLTTEGWVSIDKITLKHRVATLGDDNILEYHHPIELFEHDIDEDLYHVQGQYVDLMVTNNHKMYVKDVDTYKLIEAESIFGRKLAYKSIDTEDILPEIEEWVAYKGKVYCFDVPNHVFYVRRNDKAVWTGNSSRSGNKNIVAQLRPQSDMPYLENGMTPDIILNPHSIPSRMTVGQLLETSLSKICARKGSIIDATAFREVRQDNITKLLLEYGFRYTGKERMFNGETGEWFESDIFVGEVYIQRLQKFVLDNGYAVSRNCPTDAKTGQPLGGKAHGGGLRIGEMEDLTLNTHGACMTTYEKWSMDSDGFKMHVCRRCGYDAVFNEKESIYKCNTCKDYADISMVETTKSSVVFRQELAASNIKMKLGLKPRAFEKLGEKNILGLKPDKELNASA